MLIAEGICKGICCNGVREGKDVSANLCSVSIINVTTVIELLCKEQWVRLNMPREGE